MSVARLSEVVVLSYSVGMTMVVLLLAAGSVV
jgi:hypothetical protein